MDSLASLGLSTEPPKPELLDRPPTRRDEYIVTKKMVKHILGMAFYQVVIMYIIVFAGEYVYPEPDPAWRFERADTSSTVYPGRLWDWDNSPLYIEKYDKYGPSRHFTNVFNVFVVVQIFNMISSRQINDEKNIFQGLHRSKIFIGVFLIICGGQFVVT